MDFRFHLTLLVLMNALLVGCNGEGGATSVNCLNNFSTTDATLNKTQQLYFVPDGKCISGLTPKDIAKDVPLEIDIVPAGFEVSSTARIAHSNGKAWIEVTNNTGLTYCSVQLRTVNYLNESSDILLTSSWVDVNGYLFDTGTFTRNDCLADGDSGYIDVFSSVSNLIDDIDKVHATELIAYTSANTEVEGLETGTLTWDGDDIEFQLTNTSSNTLDLETLPATAIFYDNNYLPVGSTHLNVEGIDSIIDPGQSFSFIGTIIPSDPSYAVELILDYDLAQ